MKAKQVAKDLARGPDTVAAFPPELDINARLEERTVGHPSRGGFFVLVRAVSVKQRVYGVSSIRIL